MKLNNISGFNSIYEYVHNKIKLYESEEKNFGTLFKYMFSERENTMAETSDGYKIKKHTYGQVYDHIISIIPTVSEKLSFVGKGGTVGLYMANSIEWIELFWAILASGYSILLMNTRLGDDVLEKTLLTHDVKAVISDGKRFNITTFLASELNVPRQADAPTDDFGKEIIFMSSGTSDNIKLCAYTGESFYHQICDSIRIIDACPQMKEHYEGELKQLTLLPFCHVFGFIAVYIWFGFFARTFVFLKDMNPTTILNTVKKHKVTHIFAVPLVWDTVYKEAIRTIKGRGAATYKRFSRAVKIANSFGGLGKLFSKIALGEVRENIFGDSIKFLISGGSHIEKEVLEFFNGIGYHIANGYGMTEIGITSLDISSNRKILNLGSIGKPFGNTEYSLDAGGNLLVRGKTMPSRIITGDTEHLTSYNEWFNTQDLALSKDGRYYLLGRADDMIVCENGENINPTLVESRLKAEGVDAVCLILDQTKQPLLIISAPGCFDAEKLKSISEKTNLMIESEKLSGSIRRIVITTDKLICGNDFKISRRKVAERYANGDIQIYEPDNVEGNRKKLLSAIENQVVLCMAEALELDAKKIALDDNFFSTLGGTSLDYFVLVNLAKNRLGVELPLEGDKKMATARQICNFISNT